MSDVIANMIAGASLIGSIFSLFLANKALAKADAAIKTEKSSHLISINRIIIDEIDQWNIKHERLYRTLYGEKYEFASHQTPDNFKEFWKEIFGSYRDIVERIELTYPSAFNGKLNDHSHKVWNDLTSLKIHSYDDCKSAEYPTDSGLIRNYWTDAEGVLYDAHTDVMYIFRGQIVKNMSEQIRQFAT